MPRRSKAYGVLLHLPRVADSLTGDEARFDGWYPVRSLAEASYHQFIEELPEASVYLVAALLSSHDGRQARSSPARKFLRTTLAQGPVLQRDVIERGAAEGFSHYQLRRALWTLQGRALAARREHKFSLDVETVRMVTKIAISEHATAIFEDRNESEDGDIGTQPPSSKNTVLNFDPPYVKTIPIFGKFAVKREDGGVPHIAIFYEDFSPDQTNLFLPSVSSKVGILFDARGLKLNR